MNAHAEQTDSTLVRLGGVVTYRALAEEMEITEDRLKSYVYGRAPFPARLAPALYHAVIETTGDRALALWAFESITGLRSIGHRAKPCAAGTDGDPLPVDVAQQQGHLGDLAVEIATHGAETDATEAERALAPARANAREALEILAKLETIAGAGRQMTLGGVIG